MIKKFLYSLLIYSLLSFSTAIADHHKHIRLAIFDNPQPDPSRNQTTQQFLSSYLAGINTAIAVASSKGIEITEKEFFHTNTLANIIQQASNAKSWKPDAIIGLSTSNDFLMSKAFFGEQVIISISATDPAASLLPRGFYSLGIPDNNAINTIINFISLHYPNRNLFITIAAESKESVDYGELLAVAYKKRFGNKKVIARKFLTEDMNNLSYSKFMSGYKPNDIIVVMSIGYDSAIELMNKITAYLRPIKPVFISTTDNWGNNTTPQSMSGSYDAFRIDTLSGGEDTKDYQIFIENYKKIYHVEPKDKISFVTYRTVMSFVQAIIHYPANPKIKTTRESLLDSYSRALKHHPNWFRPPYYVVYKLENQKEVYFEKIT